MKKITPVLHCLQRLNKNYCSQEKDFKISDLRHPLIEQACEYAESCYNDANATVDYLHQTIEALQEEKTEV